MIKLRNTKKEMGFFFQLVFMEIDSVSRRDAILLKLKNVISSFLILNRRED